jgi:hypothetical protein
LRAVERRRQILLVDRLRERRTDRSVRSRSTISTRAARFIAWTSVIRIPLHRQLADLGVELATLSFSARLFANPPEKTAASPSSSSFFQAQI